MSIGFAVPAQAERPTLRPVVLPVGGSRVNSRLISAAVSALAGVNRRTAQQNWLRAIARLVELSRPDLSEQLLEHLGVTAAAETPLVGMSIGELGVVYEALLALSDHSARRSQGQYFTPDDVASFLAAEGRRFSDGTWLDPCCGVGNLSWHLAQAQVDPHEFVTERLWLIDLDPVALKTAVVLLTASFASWGAEDALPALAARALRRDFLSSKALPLVDYAIVNPPYAQAPSRAGFRTADTRDLYAYFMERVAAVTTGFVAITPASFLGGRRHQAVREILAERNGGSVYVFDNVPDTAFRGFKYGSTNTSKTNFVRAAITVSDPSGSGWRITPILRWAAASRERMWAGARDFLTPLRTAPDGEWAKLMPGTEAVWDHLIDQPSLGSLVSKEETDYKLWVASTPRYYISASKRPLDRGSQHILSFRSEEERNRAYTLINSSLPYWWWRSLDGGITLQKRTLLSVPIPPALTVDHNLVRELEASDEADIVIKLNAGRKNENVRRSRELVDRVDRAAVGSHFTFGFADVFAPDLFART
ncbi:N-6 DNA methylase [Curtobacterium flaccumfaciens]|uniref:N-6 DNA methylase n=1 Tax=Curtobacterium flaccumfaciens TaxID=2035 RepID=UPI003879BE13